MDLKAALFRKQQDVKKEKSEIQIDSTDSLTRKVSDKVCGCVGVCVLGKMTFPVSFKSKVQIGGVVKMGQGVWFGQGQ